MMNTPDSVVLEDAAPAGWFDAALSLVACLILFAPMAAMFYFYTPPDVSLADGSAELVGIAVILRATLRRLFRSGSRSVLQTAVGTVTRASARTMTRRVVRVGVKSFSMLLGRSTEVETVAGAEVSVDENGKTTQPTALAAGIGLAALAASLAGVLLLLDVEQVPTAAQPSRSAEVLRDLSLPTAVLLGIAPLAAYVGLLLVAARPCGATVRFRSGWEALLLQAYFTGSGSFLPLSTDSEISGPTEASSRLALISLGGLFALHLGCAAAGKSAGSYALEYLGGMFLLYCFVFSFPIAPLDGYYVWARSKRLWMLIWLPILAAFIWSLPESLHVIL